MNGQYILDENGKPIEVQDVLEWGRWMGQRDRHVADDRIPGPAGEIHVSTVFLGLDHSFGEEGLPVLWETMIFGGPNSDYQVRYTSHEAALEGHKKALEIAVGPAID